jgi:hypothetical protein
MAYRRYLMIVFSMLTGGILLCVAILSILSGEKKQELPGPKSGDWRLSYYEAKQPVSMDHDVVYYGIGPSMKRAKEADILILGHSMTLFAFEKDRTAEFVRRHQVALFHLGLLSETGSEFFLKLMDRFRLRPRLVLVMLEYQGRLAFLEDGLTPFASSVISEGAIRRRLSNILNERVRWWIGGEKPTHLLFRSQENGLLDAAVWPGFDETHEVFPMELANCPSPSPEMVTRAAALRDRIAKQGGRLVLFVVPGRSNCLKGTREIARRLGVTLLEIDGKEMTSFDDGYHLDRAGAILFTERFLAALAASPAFQNMKANQGSRARRNPTKGSRLDGTLSRR